MRGETGTEPGAADSVEDLNPAIVAAYPDLLRRALYLTRDREDAMDLVHRTVERACAARHQLKPGTNAAHWLGAIMTNQFIDEIRRHRASPFSHGIAPDNISAPAPDAGPVWRSLGLDDVLAAARSVPERFRVPFELHMLRGLSHRAISMRLGLPMGTTGTRIHRAKRLIKRLLIERMLQRPEEAAIPLRQAARSESAPSVLLEEIPDQFAGVEIARRDAAG